MYVARHGETEWNVKGLIQGHTDSALTKEGIIQAKNLAKELKHIRFNAAYSSDLLRAKRTAKIVALEHQLIVKTTEALRERSFGIHEGSSRKVLDLLEQLNNKQITRDLESIETDEKLTTRIITFLREIAVAHPNKTVLVVTHGGVLVRLLVHFGYFTRHEVKQFSFGNTSYIKLISDGVDFFVKGTKRIEKRKTL